MGVIFSYAAFHRAWASRHVLPWILWTSSEAFDGMISWKNLPSTRPWLVPPRPEAYAFRPCDSVWLPFHCCTRAPGTTRRVLRPLSDRPFWRRSKDAGVDSSLLLRY